MEVGLKSHETAELQLLGCLNSAFPVFESTFVPLKMRLHSKFLRFMKITFSRIAKILVVFSSKSLTIILSRKKPQNFSLIPASLHFWNKCKQV